jgi:hypothetical protein
MVSMAVVVSDFVDEKYMRRIHITFVAAIYQQGSCSIEHVWLSYVVGCASFTVLVRANTYR